MPPASTPAAERLHKAPAHRAGLGPWGGLARGPEERLAALVIAVIGDAPFSLATRLHPRDAWSDLRFSMHPGDGWTDPLRQRGPPGRTREDGGPGEAYMGGGGRPETGAHPGTDGEGHGDVPAVSPIAPPAVVCSPSVGPLMTCEFRSWPLSKFALAVVVETAKRYPSIRDDHETLARIVGAKTGLFFDRSLAQPRGTLAPREPHSPDGTITSSAGAYS